MFKNLLLPKRRCRVNAEYKLPILTKCQERMQGETVAWSAVSFVLAQRAIVMSTIVMLALRFTGASKPEHSECIGKARKTRLSMMLSFDYASRNKYRSSRSACVHSHKMCRLSNLMMPHTIANVQVCIFPQAQIRLALGHFFCWSWPGSWSGA